MTGQAVARHVEPAGFGGDGASLAMVVSAHAPDALRKALTNRQSQGRLGVIAGAGGGGDLVQGKWPLPGVGAPWPLVAPIQTEVHFSDRAQRVVAMHERCKDYH